MLVEQRRPNQFALQFTPGTDDIVLLGADGNVYSTYAAIIAAGVEPWPGLDIGLNQTGVFSIRSIDAAGVNDGQPFYYSYDKTKPASTTTMIRVSGNGQERENCPVLWQVWVSLTTSTDLIEVVWEC